MPLESNTSGIHPYCRQSQTRQDHENYMEGDRDEGEALIRSYDWYWMARIHYHF